ncbi:MAG TPA: hypothetical protein V6D07_10935 [Trichocoleus sp.]
MPYNVETQGSSSVRPGLTYRDRLCHWAIVRLLPKMQRITVARFRSRSDADGHLYRLRQLIPHAHFLVIFSPLED